MPLIDAAMAVWYTENMDIDEDKYAEIDRNMDADKHANRQRYIIACQTVKLFNVSLCRCCFTRSRIADILSWLLRAIIS